MKEKSMREYNAWSMLIENGTLGGLNRQSGWMEKEVSEEVKDAPWMKIYSIFFF